MRLLTASALCLLLNPFGTPAYAVDFSAKVVQGHSIIASGSIQKFYAEHQGQMLWVDGGQLTSDAKSIVEDIGNAWKHGLNPLNYRYPTLNEFVEHGVPQGREGEVEILFSDAIIRYAQDLSGMRLSAKDIEEDTRSWSRGINGYALLTVLADEHDRAVFIQKLAPQDRTYQRLSHELVALVEDLAKTPDKNIKIIRYPGLLKPGMRHAAIIAIRHKLGLKGNSDLYDDELKLEVQDFQSRHGLAADGLIGLRSFDAINQTRTQKLIKLIANLERRRWVRRPMPSKYVSVNIPQMYLEAVEGDKIAFEMPVIIGRDKRPTMSFVDDIIGVRFNPRWYVPDTIKSEDFLPALQKDPMALEKKGIQFRIKTEEGMKTVLPTDINWSEVKPEHLKDIQMFQDSGDENALGLIRVLMPNQYDIYLHDTNAPELFAKDDRALSSGCVRLAEPRRIANFILGQNTDWADAKIDGYIASHKIIEVTAQQPVPVYMFYYTAWVDKAGRVIIANDIYGKDKLLVQALQAKGKIPFELGTIR